MTAVSTINVGSLANDGSGDTIRAAFQKCNDNFLLVQFPGAQSAAGASGGSIASGFAYNSEELTSDAIATSTGGGSVNGWKFKHSYGGALLTGARQTMYIESDLTAASSASNTNRNYVGLVVSFNATSGDGGTNTGAGSKGACFALNLNTRAFAGATNLASVVGCEADVVMEAGSTARGRFGFNPVSWGAVNGVFDAAFAVSTAAGQSASWKFGLLIGKTFWGTSNPLSTDGVVVGTDGHNSTVKSGIDLSSLTFTDFFLKGPNGFSVNGAGKIAGDLSGFTITADGAVKPYP